MTPEKFEDLVRAKREAWLWLMRIPNDDRLLRPRRFQR